MSRLLLRLLPVLVAVGTVTGCAASTGAGEWRTPVVGHGSPRPGAAVPPSARADCVASVEEATVRRADPPGATCLVVGATLKITSEPSPTAPWRPVAVSQPGVLDCTSKSGANGVLSGSCKARKAGTVTLTSVAGGQADQKWQFTVRVVA